MRAIYTLFLSAVFFACSSDDSAQNDAGDAAATDASPDVDPGPDASGTYPAFKIDAPQVVTLGGPVLGAPKVQPVYFPGFDYATQMTDFTSKLGASSYWAGLTEYKIAPITSAAPIALTSAQIVPADIGAITDAYIQSWLQSRFDGTHPEFGTTPDPTAIYALFYPASTVVYLSGGPAPDGGTTDAGGFGNQKSCTSFGGYHGEVVIGTAHVAYAVLPECPTFGSYTGVDVATTTASHELSEAVTDPLVTSNMAYGQNDDNHVAWMFFLGGGEIGDMCAQFPSSFYVPTDFNHLVQRNWSNVAAKAGHDPCVPADKSPYFNTMPVFPDSVTTRGGIITKGLKVPIGQAVPLELDLFSDAPTSGPWTVKAQALTRGGTAPVTFAFDKTTGQNGDKIMLTVTSTAAFTSSSKTATLVVTSTLGVRENIWVGILAQ